MKREYWIGAIAGLGVLDCYCAYVRHEGTLSQAGRETFHTDTPAGKAIWTASWLCLTAWILPHVWNWPEDIKKIVNEIS